MKKSDFTLCQTGQTNEAQYETYSFSSRRKRFGFVCINLECEYVCNISFNSVEEYADMMGCDVKTYARLLWLDVGEQVTIEGEIYVRLW